MADYRQKNRAFDGTAAYELYDNGPSENASVKRSLPRDRRRAKAKNNKMSVVNLACVAAVLLVFAFQIFGNVRLYESKTALAELQNRLDAATQAQSKLRAEYEGELNFAEIEQAATRLGMAKPSGTESIYIDLSGEDYGEVLKPHASVLASAVQLTGEALSSLEAYLAQPET